MPRKKIDVAKEVRNAVVGVGGGLRAAQTVAHAKKQYAEAQSTVCILKPRSKTTPRYPMVWLGMAWHDMAMPSLEHQSPLSDILPLPHLTNQ